MTTIGDVKWTSTLVVDCTDRAWFILWRVASTGRLKAVCIGADADPSSQDVRERFRGWRPDDDGKRRRRR